MKQFIWMLCGIFLSGLLLGNLSACGSTQYGTAVITTPQPSEEETGSAPEEAAPENEDEEDMGVEDMGTEDLEAGRNTAYGKVLADALADGVLPDGTRLDYTDKESASENEFALADVDGDGEDELILYWTNAITAGQMCIVYRWEDGAAVRQELCETPGVTFYDNGAVTADWSHNQGWGGRFWPYTIYQYSKDTQDYVQVGAVDAWDVSCTEETFPNAFPKDIDADGDGLVYFLLSGEWYQGERTDPDGNTYVTWSVDPVDGPDYENWRDVFHGGAEEIEITRRKLTEENIAALG